jgi:hypothetical protein
MKAKKFRKKLTFNKQTIAHLSNFEINGVLGGRPADTVPASEPLLSRCPVCPTFNIECGPTCSLGDPCC